MKKTKASLALLIAALLCVSMFSACVQSGPGASSPDAQQNNPASDAPSVDVSDDQVNTEHSGTITHWVWGEYEMDGARDFNLFYPNLNVNYVAIPQDEYTQRLQTTVASGLELPDVVNLEMTPRAQFIAMDAWENLEAAPFNLDRSLLVPMSIPLVSNDRGEIVSVQIDNCVGGYAFNRELAIKYFGTDDIAELEAKFPTFESIIDIAGTIDSDDYLFAGVDDAFMALFGLYTTEPLVVDGKLNLEYAYLPTYEYLEKLVAADAVNMYLQWSPAWNTAFAENNILFWPGPSWFLTFVMKANDSDSVGKYGVMNPPGGGFSWGGTSYSIPKARPDEQKLLAWEYIRWFTMSIEGNRSFVREQATPTLFLPSFDTDMYDGNEDPYFGGQDVVRKLIEISQDPKTNVRPMTAYDQGIQDANDIVRRHIEQGMGAQEAYDRLVAEVLLTFPELSA